VALHPQVQP